MSKRSAAYQAVEKSYQRGQRRCHICSCQLIYNPRLTGKGCTVPKNLATFEHLVPKSQGGTKAPINGLIICGQCNHRRGNTNWLKWIEAEQPSNKEWLLEKYLDALEYHTNRTVQAAKLAVPPAVVCKQPTKQGITLRSLFDLISNCINKITVNS